jgi:hypothetical protein
MVRVELMKALKVLAKASLNLDLFLWELEWHEENAYR